MVLKRSCPAVSLQEEEEEKKKLSTCQWSSSDGIGRHSPDLKFDSLPVQLHCPNLEVDPWNTKSVCDTAACSASIRPQEARGRLL